MTDTLWELWRKPPKYQSVTSQIISTGLRWRYPNQQFKEDLEGSKIEAIPQDANHSSVVRIGRQDYNLQSTSMSHKSWNKVLWTEYTKINGGGSVIAWVCMAASGVGSLIFIDDVTHAGSLQKYSVCQLREKCVQTNWEGTSSCRKTMTQNTLPTQEMTSLNRKNVRFETGQVNHQTTIDLLIRRKGPQ